MKTTLKKATQPSQPAYPCLMIGIYSDNIYLMTDDSVGTRIHSSSGELGEWSGDWAMDTLEPYYGTVTLEN